MIWAILRYIPRAIVDVLADLLAYPLAPIAALFVTIDSNGRYQLHPAWRWIYTHDAPVDSGHVDGYWKTTGYWSRVKWIWRNPAYQVSHWLGYDQTGVDTTRGLYKDPRWDSGVPNRAFWKVRNSRGQVGFLYQRQWYYWRDFCIEMQFGWKLYRRDPDKRCMLAFRCVPKRYILSGD